MGKAMLKVIVGLVIGAGLIGSSLAWRLAQRGVKVTLADSGRYFGECSWAGAGMLSPRGERFPDPGVWIQRAESSLAQYPAFVDELQRESGEVIDYCHCGARERTPEGDREFPEEAIVNPRDLGVALRDVLKQHGVQLHQYQGFQAIGGHEADAIVVAAGAWSSQITVSGESLPACVPVKGYLLGYDGLAPGSLGPVLREGHTYLLQRKDGFTIAGSTEERIGYDRSIDPALVKDLHERAGRLWEPLARIQPSRVWSGLRPATESGQIYCERWKQTNVWLAYGFFRNGILLAPWTADPLAGQIVSASSETGSPATAGSL